MDIKFISHMVHIIINIVLQWLDYGKLAGDIISVKKL